MGHSHQDTSRWAWRIHHEQMFLFAFKNMGHSWRLCLLNPCSLEDNSRAHLCSFAQILEYLNWVTVQFSCSVMSNSLLPHGLQHARLPCPSPTRGACSNSCPLSQWCHPTISSSLFPFSSCLQSFPVSWSFPMSLSYKGTLKGPSSQSYGFSSSHIWM